MIVVDTGPIVAATFLDDKNHERCVQEFVRLKKANRPLLVPSFVAAESCYMLGRLGGPKTVAERTRVAEVMTVDARDFSVVRPIHTPAFTLLPA
ncbi:PIN domain-containing protein [Microbispora sp. KK1-11]|uniref:PIN domain-containing protein n=1 Tax=Microbispora sp. KK1-11 TaxID=2053005 RepID=UPI00115822EC|nr:PIN domain-containing protein [Microbispora sp. KK1-11]TQS26246.1 type II toxin-antitoxin system VapC family toxin [Microbispora sp. KK1-11]